MKKRFLIAIICTIIAATPFILFAKLTTKNPADSDSMSYDNIVKHGEYGTIIYESNHQCCEECGLEVHSTYAERFILDEKYKGAETMNQQLLMEMQQNPGLNTAYEPLNKPHESHKDMEDSAPGKYEKRIDSIQPIGSQYLEINYSGYLYEMGMGHGEPFREHEMFHLDTGKEVGFSDFYTGSLDAFKKKIAEYTIKDWKENTEKYFPQVEEEFYQSVYEYASYDMPVQFMEDGIIVEYGPYQYGPFSSGIIGVKIPYGELGIEDAIFAPKTS